MKQIQFIAAFSIIFFFTCSCWTVNAQERITVDTDTLLKETIYNKNKAKVLNYSLKEFDALFFEFFDKKSSSSSVMTKEEFYTYTIQIAIFSDRLAALYPDQKEIAAANKKRWFAESFEDYLVLKTSPKK